MRHDEPISTADKSSLPRPTWAPPVVTQSAALPAPMPDRSLAPTGHGKKKEPFCQTTETIVAAADGCCDDSEFACEQLAASQGREALSCEWLRLSPVDASRLERACKRNAVLEGPTVFVSHTMIILCLQHIVYLAYCSSGRLRC